MKLFIRTDSCPPTVQTTHEFGLLGPFILLCVIGVTLGCGANPAGQDAGPDSVDVPTLADTNIVEVECVECRDVPGASDVHSDTRDDIAGDGLMTDVHQDGDADIGNVRDADTAIHIDADACPDVECADDGDDGAGDSSQTDVLGVDVGDVIDARDVVDVADPVDASPFSCVPCSETRDCSPAGVTSGLECVAVRGDLGLEGSFCLKTCNDPDDCPAQYNCVGYGDSGDSFCTWKGGDGAICECGPVAVDSEIRTACTIANASGECTGSRYCDADGLTPCDAAIPDVETCNGIDDNCNGLTDEGVQSNFYLDSDADGFGNAAIQVTACQAPDGYSADDTDCDDTRKTVCPSCAETCDSLDNDCDGIVDGGVRSCDIGCGLGFEFCQAGVWVDCNAPAPLECTDYETCLPGHLCAAECPPAPSETLNGLDDDCDGETDEGTCVPDCDGVVCGDDGCGGSCGSCDGGYLCEIGQCVDDCAGLLCGPSPTLGFDCGSCWTGSVCNEGHCEVEMMPVPAGAFQMGCDGEIHINECMPHERPLHQVTLTNAYLVDRTEVTQSEYKRCIDAGVCTAPGNSFDLWSPEARPAYPVHGISWSQADVYCSWVGKRLPTEAEWEKAARGTDGRKYPWGDDNGTCAEAVRYYYDGTSTCGGGGPMRVCSKSPVGDSPYGLCDMAGNVSEWVADWYGENYYWENYFSGEPVIDPIGPSTGGERVWRSGSWTHWYYDVRTTSRGHDEPGGVNWASQTGFRCAMDAE